MLRDALVRGRVKAQEKALLGWPCCWPGDPALAAVALAAGRTPPTAPPGGVLLVAVATPDPTGEAVGALAWLEPEAPHPGAAVFVRDAERALERARRRATRDVLSLVEAPNRRPPRWSARKLWRCTNTLDGASFGFAMAVAHVSWSLGVPAPADTAALAVVEADGSLSPVDGLIPKIRAIWQAACAVRRIVVARDQRQEAEGAVAAAGATLDVVGVATLAEGLHAVLPDLQRTLVQRWSEPEVARAAARRLYQRAFLGDDATAEWRPIRNAASTLADLLALDATPEGQRAREQAALARDIAARHTGAPVEPRWPDEERLAALPLPLRLRWLAHAVQSAADHDDASAVAYATRAQPFVPDDPGQRFPDHLRLLGAIGRALAAAGRGAAALEHLEQAVSGWIALEHAHEASHALCEALRLHGEAARRDDVERLRGALEEVLGDGRTSESAQAFLFLARGRALAQCGDFAGATPVLDGPEIDWESIAAMHAARSRRRWFALVLDGIGERERADAERAVLAAGADDDYAWLGRLDRALRDGIDARSLLDEARAHGDESFHEVRRTIARFEGEPDAARRVARHYRY